MTLLEERPGTAARSLTSLTGAQKAALVLVALGEEVSSQVVKLLTEEELKAATKSISDLPVVTAEQAQGVLEEFYLATLRDFPHQGGADYAKRILVGAFGPDGSRHLVTELNLGDGKEEETPGLQQTDPQQLAKLIEREHPQTIAILLTHLGPKPAASLMAALDRQLRAKVLMRIAALDSVSEELVRKVIGVVALRVKSLGEIKRGVSIGGIRTAAEMLNAMDPELSNEVLSDLKEKKETLEEQIRGAMFVFEDIQKIDGKGIKEILSKTDRKVLTIAMKGASDALRKHVFSCMSQRGSEMIREDMEAMGPVKIRDVEAAQQQVIRDVRALQQLGTISSGGGGDEEYVD